MIALLLAPAVAADPARYPPVPAFKPWFTPGLHMPQNGTSMQDPAGNIILGDGTFHVFPCCEWIHFASQDLLHWQRGEKTPMAGGTGSIAVLPGGAVVAVAPKRGVTLFTATDTADCKGPGCLETWSETGVVATTPARATAGFRDPARPFQSANGTWWMVVGAGVKSSRAEALLFRASDQSLSSFEYAGVLHAANRTLSFAVGTHGFFDMMECPDFFPLGDDYWVLISSAYLSSQPPYPRDGFHNAVTWWLGRWDPTQSAGLDVLSSGVIDYGAVSYYSAKSIAGPSNSGPRRLLGGWVMDSNGMSEPRLCKNGGSDQNSKDWVICPEALHRELTVCYTNRSTEHGSDSSRPRHPGATGRVPVLCQHPAPELRGLRVNPPSILPVVIPEASGVKTAEDGPVSRQVPFLGTKGLQTEVELNVTIGAATAGKVGVYLLASAESFGGDDGMAEQTLVGYDVARRELFVDRSKSSLLPPAAPHGGITPGGTTQGYGVRSREAAPAPEVAADGLLRITAFLDHSIITVFANDVAVITTRVYTSSAASDGAGWFVDGWVSSDECTGVAKAWPLLL